MFTPKHFVWLGICIFIILSILLLNKKFKFSFKTNLNALFIVCILSEVVKIIANMDFQTAEGGSSIYLDPGALPFHLCSIQIFLVFALMFFVKKESTKQILLQFMYPTMVAGAVLSILIPTCGVKFNRPIVYQYFIYHAYIIGFGLYLVLFKQIKVTWKTFGRNLGILASLLVAMLWINSALSIYGTNFFYVTRPPMSNLPFLNLNHGWFVYIIHLICAALIMMSITHLPLILLSKEESK